MTDSLSTEPLGVVEIVLGVPDSVSAPLDVEFETPLGAIRRVPAFTSSGKWRVRYASPEVGEHRYRLRDVAGSVLISGSPDPRSAARCLQVSSGDRRFEAADGSPFLWLADTWWEALTDRISDEELAELSSRRVAQGFSLVQLVIGLFPEMAPFSPEARLDGHWAWHQDLSGPDEEWFERADARVRLIIEAGLMPCIVGGWGYYLQHLSVAQMVRHWREIVARWGAYPVAWCVAGEVTGLDPRTVFDRAQGLEHERPRLSALARLAGYGLRRAIGSIAEKRPAGFPESEAIATLLGLKPDVIEQVNGWNDVARAVRSLDPYGRPLTVHPQPNWPPYDVIDEDLVDFWMLQTGHSGFHTLGSSLAQLDHALHQIPRKPVLVGEVCYEGIMGSSGPEMQRFLFWSHMLSGAAGHTYGAQGLWGFNTADYPAGLGGRWNETTWSEAAHLPGADHVGIGRLLLQDLPWHRFDPHPEWVTPHATRRDRIRPYAGGTPDGVRVVYFPVAGLVKKSLGFHSVTLNDLGKGNWTATFINPRTTDKEAPIVIEPADDGSATLTGGLAGALPSKEDWLLVLTPSDTPV